MTLEVLHMWGLVHDHCSICYWYVFCSALPTCDDASSLKQFSSSYSFSVLLRVKSLWQCVTAVCEAREQKYAPHLTQMEASTTGAGEAVGV